MASSFNTETASATRGGKLGNQPVGGNIDIVKESEEYLPGHENDSDGTIEITYTFSDGISCKL